MLAGRGDGRVRPRHVRVPRTAVGTTTHRSRKRAQRQGLGRASPLRRARSPMYVPADPARQPQPAFITPTGRHFLRAVQHMHAVTRDVLAPPRIPSPAAAHLGGQTMQVPTVTTTCSRCMPVLIVLITVSCTDGHQPGGVANRLLAGSLGGEQVFYNRLDRSEFETLAGTAQPFVRFETDTGLQTYLLSAKIQGDVPTTPHEVSRGIVRAGPKKPWYCVEEGTFEYPPRTTRGQGRASIGGFSRLPDCGEGLYEISFEPSLAAAERRELPQTNFPLLSGGVLSYLPSEATWTFSAPAGDFYLSLNGNAGDDQGGFLIVIGYDPATVGLRFGVACTRTSTVQGKDLVVGGVSDIQWCPGTTPDQGQITLEPN